MSPMNRSRILRSVVLLSAGALAVHELRYAVIPAHDALATSAHAYLALVTPGLVVLAVLALALLVRHAGRGSGATPALARLWATACGILLAVHFAQESLESALSGSGSPFGAGALVAVGAAAAVGAVVALGLRGSAALEHSRPVRAGRQHAVAWTMDVFVALVSRPVSFLAGGAARPRAPPFVAA
jgi:hypothetical protein